MIYPPEILAVEALSLARLMRETAAEAQVVLREERESAPTPVHSPLDTVATAYHAGIDTIQSVTETAVKRLLGMGNAAANQSMLFTAAELAAVAGAIRAGAETAREVGQAEAVRQITERLVDAELEEATALETPHKFSFSSTQINIDAAGYSRSQGPLEPKVRALLAKYVGLADADGLEGNAVELVFSDQKGERTVIDLSRFARPARLTESLEEATTLTEEELRLHPEWREFLPLGESREVRLLEDWVTIGSAAKHDDEEAGKHGGVHVFFGQGGKIEKGPPHMMGKKLSELKGSKVTATHGKKHPADHLSDHANQTGTTEDHKAAMDAHNQAHAAEVERVHSLIKQQGVDPYSKEGKQLTQELVNGNHNLKANSHELELLKREKNTSTKPPADAENDLHSQASSNTTNPVGSGETPKQETTKVDATTPVKRPHPWDDLTEAERSKARYAQSQRGMSDKDAADFIRKFRKPQLTGVKKGKLAAIPISKIDFGSQRLPDVAPLSSNKDQPIIVKKSGDRYVVQDGYGRANGLANAGQNQVHVIVVSDSDLASRKGGVDDPDWVSAMYAKYAPHLKKRQSETNPG